MKSKSTRSRIESTLRSQSRRHYLLLSAIVLMAAIFRFWNLSGMPVGMHGDEGIVGYEARRILQQGSIGPYSPASWGQPSGPIYLVAPFVALWGNELISIRFVPALIGTLTILALYGLVEPRLGKKTALISVFVLAILPWHIHYARIAFPLESWPLSVILIIWALLAALEKPSWQRFALAGFLNGIGVYVYKAHPVFLLLSSLFGFVALIRQQEIPLKTKTFSTFTYLGSMLLAANFLLRYVLTHGNQYGGQFGIASIFNQPAWLEQVEFSQKILFLIERYFGFWENALTATEIDYVDGSGLIPLLPWAIFALFMAGFFSFKRQEPLVLWSRIIVLVMPIAHVVTVDGFARRTFPLAPFLCILAAVGAYEILQFGNDKRIGRRLFAPTFVSMLLFWGAIQSWRDYFVIFANHPTQAIVFCHELTQALSYIKTLPPEIPIYFYSGRWSITYDTRKFMAPELNAIDCSKEYSRDNSLIIIQDRPVVKTSWVFMAPYLYEFKLVKKMFPGGKEIKGPPDFFTGQPSFLAYELN